MLSRYSRAQILTAAAFFLVGVSLVGYYLYTQNTYLVAYETVVPVHQNHRLESADLKPVKIVSGEQTSAVIGQQLQQVLGKAALMDIVKGTIISAEAFGDRVVSTGTAIIGWSAELSQLPVWPLFSGQTVTLIDTADNSSPLDEIVNYPAVIISAWQSGSGFRIDLEVKYSDRLIIGQLAANRQLTIAVVGQQEVLK